MTMQPGLRESGQTLNNSVFSFSELDGRACTLARLVALMMVIAAVLLCSSALVAAQPETDESCLVPGQWSTHEVAALRRVAAAEVLAQARDAQFVLLGEAHDNA